MACLTGKSQTEKFPPHPKHHVAGASPRGVHMVKGSHPFWELGKLRVGVAEIEMIPTVDGGSRNLRRKTTV